MPDPAPGGRRITFVALNYAPSVGGAQAHVRHLAEGLAERGHEVRVLTTDLLHAPASGDRARVTPRRQDVGGVHVERCAVGPGAVRAQRLARIVARRLDRRLRPARPLMDWPWLSGPWSLGFARAVRRATRSSDVVIGCSAPFLSLLLPPLLQPRRGGARIIAMPLLHAGGDAPRRAVARALARCHDVVASTSFEARSAAGAGAARTHVIPPGTDPARFPHRTPPAARQLAGLPERPTVGFVGRIAAYKGVDTVVAAAPLVWERRPDVGILVAGSPTVWTGHRDPAIAELGGDRYVVREAFAEQDLPLLVAACDVVVHPSREESFGLTALDAWAARRPVVLADLGCVRSFARPGTDALLVPPGDPAALAEAVLDLLDDAEARTAMGEAGRAAVEERFNWDAACEAWGELVAATGEVR